MNQDEVDRLRMLAEEYVALVMAIVYGKHGSTRITGTLSVYRYRTALWYRTSDTKRYSYEGLAEKISFIEMHAWGDEAGIF